MLNPDAEWPFFSPASLEPTEFTEKRFITISFINNLKTLFSLRPLRALGKIKNWGQA